MTVIGNKVIYVEFLMRLLRKSVCCQNDSCVNTFFASQYATLNCPSTDGQYFLSLTNKVNYYNYYYLELVNYYW